jgi:hypothetical protein
MERLRAGRRSSERSRHRSRQRGPGAERITRETNLFGIFAGELLMRALFARRQRAVGDHQRKLVPPQQGIEVQDRSPNAVSGSTSCLSPVSAYKCHASDAPNVGFCAPDYEVQGAISNVSFPPFADIRKLNRLCWKAHVTAGRTGSRKIGAARGWSE